MAVRQFKQKFQTLDNQLCFQSKFQPKNAINDPMSSPINLSDNRRNQIIEVLPKKDKTDKSVKNKIVDKSDINAEKSGKREPKCTRCANHKSEPVLVKGHKRSCEFRLCECELCILTDKRRAINAKTNCVKRGLVKALEIGSHDVIEPVLKKERSDDCLSETDKESDYSTNTEDKYFEYIWKEFLQIYSNESLKDVGKHVLDWSEDRVKQKIKRKKTTQETKDKRKISKKESSDQRSSVKSKDSNNDLNITSPLTPPKTPISSPTTSSTHSVECYNYPLIRPTPFYMPYPMSHYNQIIRMNEPNFLPLMYKPNMLYEQLSR